jgi:hypothetical protein
MLQCSYCTNHTYKYTDSVAFSPQVSYTDWATAVPTFAGRLVSHGQRGGHFTAVNLGFLDRSRYFFFQVAPHFSSRGWVEPVPDPLLFRKSGSAWNRTGGLWICTQEFWSQEVCVKYRVFKLKTCGAYTQVTVVLSIVNDNLCITFRVLERICVCVICFPPFGSSPPSAPEALSILHRPFRSSDCMQINWEEPVSLRTPPHGRFHWKLKKYTCHDASNAGINLKRSCNTYLRCATNWGNLLITVFDPHRRTGNNIYI